MFWLTVLEDEKFKIRRWNLLVRASKYLKSWWETKGYAGSAKERHASERGEQPGSFSPQVVEIDPGPCAC